MVHFQYDNLKPMTLVPKVSIIRHLPHFRNLRSLGTKCLTQGKINSVICKTEIYQNFVTEDLIDKLWRFQSL